MTRMSWESTRVPVRLRWDTPVMPDHDGYAFTSGPIVTDGIIVAGLSGCGRYRDDTCYIIGLDARTGQVAWRTSTVARPGEAGGDTWGDLPVMFRAGSDAWIPGSYDPVNRLIYYGTGAGKALDTRRARHRRRRTLQ